MRRSNLRDRRAIAAAALAAALALACGEAAPKITTCTPGDGIEPHCGFQNPEDLALLPDGRTVVASQFGTMEGTKPGNLAVFVVDAPAPRVVFVAAEASDSEERWGDPACPGPPSAEFAPHGLDLEARPDGRLQLLVVNHGGREAIEFFEVKGEGDEASVVWRGCAVTPEGMYVNDVVHTPEGGFLTTHMMDRGSQNLAILKGAVLGMATGWVLEWSPPDQWKKIEGSDAPMPNGIELSPDGRTIYMNAYLGGEVWKIDRKSGEVLAVADVPGPDNVTWTQDGTALLVASHVGSVRDSTACFEVSDGTCGMPFQIVALDPETFEKTVLVDQSGPPMGAATVALQVGDDLWLGTFAGDRVARVVGGASR
jgi:sugar lactone lactonase YvrE